MVDFPQGVEWDPEALTTATAFTTASAPFDDPEADVILRTTDGVHFYIHKLLLSLSSPFFKGMFTIPDDRSQEIFDSRSCICISDNSKGVYQLLSWCDPRAQPSTALDDLQLALELADKYGMECVVKRVEALLDFSKSLYSVKQHVQLYAIAVQFRFRNLGKCAARRILSLSVDEIPKRPEFRNISGIAVHNLYQYHFACRRLARSALIEGCKSLGSGPPPPPTGCICETRSIPGFPDIANKPKFKLWFSDYANQLSDKLYLIPVGSTAKDPILVEKVISTMMSCPSCCKKIGAFKKIRNWLCASIDAEVSKVVLDMDF